jgi:hypothetical protein
MTQVPAQLLGVPIVPAGVEQHLKAQVRGIVRGTGTGVLNT